MTHLILTFVFSVLLIPGLVLAFIPMMPAFSYMLLVATVFGFFDGFTHLTLEELIILGGIFLLSVVSDWSAGLIGAKFGGGSFRGLIGGVIGSVLGFLFLPPVGGFIGVFLGVLVAETMLRRTQKEALQAARGALIGSLAGVAINVCLAVSFLTLFLVFAVR